MITTKHRALNAISASSATQLPDAHPPIGIAMAPFRLNRMVINFPSGKRFIMMFHSSDSVAYVKIVIEGKTGIPAKHQVLRWTGAAEPLVDNRTLKSYNICDEVHIKMEVLLEGGCNEFMNFDTMHDEFGF